MIELLKNHLWSWQLEIIDQIKRVRDGLPYTIVKKYRQSGASEAACWLACLQAYTVDDHRILCIAQKEGTAVETYIERIKKRVLPVLKTWKPDFFGKVEVTRTQITFPNGSVIKALATNIEGIRGETRASVICDEFAAWSLSEQMAWRSAVKPIVDSNQNPHGFLLIISTPKGRHNSLYADIWLDREHYNEATGWYRVEYDVYDAIQQGIDGWTPERWEQEQASTPDKAYLAREYEGKFSQANLSYYPDVTQICDQNPLEGVESKLRWYAGVDVGGTSDPTCAVLIGIDDEDHHYVWEPIYIWSSDFRFQCRELAMYFEKAKTEIGFDVVDKVTVDSSAHKTFPTLLEDYVPYTVKGQQFTRSWKTEHSEHLLEIIHEDRIRLSVNALVLADGDTSTEPYLLVSDLAAVRQVMTRNGNVSYEADRSDGRHSDGWSALLCALDAATSGNWHFV